MNILNILSRNVVRRARTRRPDDRVPCPPRFRGLVRHDPSLCVGCGACAYVCAPGGIRLETGEDGAVWSYFAGQCTFCGRCEEFCPTGALRLSESAPETATEAATLRTADPVPTRDCPRCGRAVTPLPATTAAQLYGWPLPEDAAALLHLCERCRKRVTAERQHEAWTGGGRE